MSKEVLLKISGVPVYWVNETYVEFLGEATVCADGAPDAYGPSNSGTDYTENAGYPGNYWGIVCDRNGAPVIQIKDYPGHPCPGMYVSCTCYGHSEYPEYDCRHWVDASKVEYSVIPSNVRASVSPKFMGCRAEVYDKKTDKTLECVCAEVGPSTHLGEMSMKACEFFGLDSNPKAGGSSEKKRFRYRFYPGDPFEGWTLQ